MRAPLGGCSLWSITWRNSQFLDRFEQLSIPKRLFLCCWWTWTQKILWHLTSSLSGHLVAHFSLLLSHSHSPVWCFYSITICLYIQYCLVILLFFPTRKHHFCNNRTHLHKYFFLSFFYHFHPQNARSLLNGYRFMHLLDFTHIARISFEFQNESSLVPGGKISSKDTFYLDSCINFSVFAPLQHFCEWVGMYKEPWI